MRQTITTHINGIIRFFLYVLIFWLPYSPAVIESCVVISLILWIVKHGILFFAVDLSKRTAKEKLLEFIKAFRPAVSFLDGPIALFILACLLSIAGSAFFDQALRGFLTKTLEWFIIYFLVIEAFTEKKYIQIAVATFLFSALAVGLDAIIQFHITHTDLFYNNVITDGRATAAFKHSNDLAGYLIFVVPVAYFLIFMNSEQWYLRGVFVVLFAITLWSIVLSNSRGGWMGIFCGILFFLFFMRRKLSLIILASVLSVLIFFSFFLTSTMRHQFRMDQPGVQNTMDSRIGLWRDSLVMIKDRPFFGHGLNTYMRLFQVYRKIDYRPTYAHNCFLQIAAEVGLFGLVSFLYIMFKLFERAMKLVNSLPQGIQGKALLMGLLVGAAAFLVQSFVDTNLYSLQLSALFWYMVGLIASVYNLLNNKDIHAIKLA